MQMPPTPLSPTQMPNDANHQLPKSELDPSSIYPQSSGAAPSVSPIKAKEPHAPLLAHLNGNYYLLGVLLIAVLIMLDSGYGLLRSARHLSIYIIIYGLQFLLGLYLFKLNELARVILVVLSVLNLLSSLLTFFSLSATFSNAWLTNKLGLYIIFSWALQITLIVYLTRPKVKAQFS